MMTRTLGLLMEALCIERVLIVMCVVSRTLASDMGSSLPARDVSLLRGGILVAESSKAKHRRQG